MALVTAKKNSPKSNSSQKKAKSTTKNTTNSSLRAMTHNKLPTSYKKKNTNAGIRDSSQKNPTKYTPIHIDIVTHQPNRRGSSHGVQSYPSNTH